MNSYIENMMPKALLEKELDFYVTCKMLTIYRLQDELERFKNEKILVHNMVFNTFLPFQYLSMDIKHDSTRLEKILILESILFDRLREEFKGSVIIWDKTRR